MASPRAHQGIQAVGIQEAYCNPISIPGLDKEINKHDLPGGRHSRWQSTCGRESWGHSGGKTGDSGRESRRGSSIRHRSGSHRAGGTYSPLLSIPANNTFRLLGKRTSTKGHPSSSGHTLTRTRNQTGLLFLHWRRTFHRDGDNSFTSEDDKTKSSFLLCRGSGLVGGGLGLLSLKKQVRKYKMMICTMENTLTVLNSSHSASTKFMCLSYANI